MAIKYSGVAALKLFQSAHHLPDDWLDSFKSNLPEKLVPVAVGPKFSILTNEASGKSWIYIADLSAPHTDDVAKLTQRVEKWKVNNPGYVLNSKSALKNYTTKTGDEAIQQLQAEAYIGYTKAKWFKENLPAGSYLVVTTADVGLAVPSGTVFILSKTAPVLIPKLMSAVENLKLQPIIPPKEPEFSNYDFSEGTPGQGGQTSEYSTPAYPMPQPSDLQDVVAQLDIAAGSTAMELLTGVKAQPAAPIEKAQGFTPVAPIGQYPVFNPSQMMDAPTVALKDAHGLYCPVAGTSGGSRYFLVADYGNLKIAARIQGNKLSLRAEGQKLAYYHKLLTSLGFESLSKGKDYRSVHVELGLSGLPHVLDAKRALAAILTGLDTAPLNPPANLSVVAAGG